MKHLDRHLRFITLLALALTSCLALASPAALADSSPPAPGGEPADTSRPVQVYILMGQSNMLGFGKIGQEGQDGTLAHAVKQKGLYPYLIDDKGRWTTRRDVRNVRVMAGRRGMQTPVNQWLTIGKGNIGPEIGIGHHLGEAVDAPVLLLKSCIGNRCLGWDLLPPGSERYEYGGKIHAGYKDSYSNVKGPWEKGEAPAEPDGGQWYAGWQYDIDVANAKKVLDQLDKHYPGARSYEVAGFFWWQGDKDRGRGEWASRYEANLVQLIKALRQEFSAPDAPFVCATLGQPTNRPRRATTS